MAPRQRRSKVPKKVADKATPNVLDLETLKRDAKAAASDEGRIEGAKPFPLKQPPLDGEVLVAPAVGEEFLHRIMSMSSATLMGSAPDENDDGIDRAFVKALAAFCMQVSMLDTHVTIGERLLAIDTEAHALFCESAVGSLNTRMPV
jgi:hypothetical protein